MDQAEGLALRAAWGDGVGDLLVRSPSWETAVLLGIAIWSFCRSYYFAFYVIEKYVDPGFRFSGLWNFFGYWFRSRK